MKKSTFSIKNIIYLVIIVALIVPQSRKQIQIVLNKGKALFGPSIKATEDAEQISSYNWDLQRLDGETFDFKTTKNKVVLVNLWATWCPPCIAEMPSIQELHDDYRDKIDFVLVSNENKDIISKFLNNNAFTFPVYSAISKSPETFSGRSIPRTFLIDRQGNIIIDETGAANWNSDKVRAKIDELLVL
ncbi:TlpA family protein disulfide reductase [Bizionia gelidisalsuginis]|uniref:TlpA family protein disulfide reductase n=1 Tax=Bizionia gelidisalsuginis TaxID=291188 RepID=A0ABY3M870_9FLAO|nr:TlpA disulfide reductase family protein [Bizionia gelidisalsuginis]TYC09739.1 TlpA family protein disulfide reductase [Bizionia gelidisalsuginis]